MQASDLIRLYDYHYWANRRVWDCAMLLTDEQLNHELGYSIGSIHRQLVHTMDVEWFWFRVIRGTLPEDTDMWPKIEEFPSRESIRAKWDVVEGEIRDFLAHVSQDELNRIIYHPISHDAPRPCRVWEALLYVTAHAVDHRAQILAGIHQLGGHTVAQDFIVYVWERGLDS